VAGDSPNVVSFSLNTMQSTQTLSRNVKTEHWKALLYWVLIFLHMSGVRIGPEVAPPPTGRRILRKAG